MGRIYLYHNTVTNFSSKKRTKLTKSISRGATLLGKLLQMKYPNRVLPVVYRFACVKIPLLVYIQIGKIFLMVYDSQWNNVSKYSHMLWGEQRQMLRYNKWISNLFSLHENRSDCLAWILYWKKAAKLLFIQNTNIYHESKSSITKPHSFGSKL